MTNQIIETVQDYLTMITDNRVKRIIDVKALMERHPIKVVVCLLEDLTRQKESMLEELLKEDKTSSIINETIATVFRLNMAIETIQTCNKQEVEMA